MVNNFDSRQLNIIEEIIFSENDRLSSLNSQTIKNLKLDESQVLVIELSDQDSLDSLSAIRREEYLRRWRSKLKKKFNQLISNYIMISIDIFRLAVFFDHKIIAGQDLIKEIELDDDFNNIEIIFGLGQYYDSIEELSISYQEAVQAIDYARFFSSKVASYRAIITERIARSLFNNEKERLILSLIRSNNYQQAKNEFFELKEAIYQECWPAEIKIRIYNLLRKIKSEIKKGINLEEKNIKEPVELNSLINSLNARQVDEIVDEFWLWIFQTFKEQLAYPSLREEIQSALDYIRNNYHRDITLEEISKKVGLSKYYFSHLFSNEIGENFSSYLSQYRLNRASQLLLDNRKENISEIAYKAGFNDPNYFARAFKEKFDLSPSKYRNSK
ncbi:MAG: helix-turn-helix domain-containing protein [Bacillota bacterium]